MMSANWYVVKYIPDVFRNEPRNVGVVVTAGPLGEARFIGEREGKIDGRRVGRVVRSSKALRSWARYVRYHLSEGTFEAQLEKLNRRALDNYRIESRGALLEPINEGNLHDVVNQLFGDLVGEKETNPPSLDELATRILFHGLELPPRSTIEKDVEYRVPVRGIERNLQFDYRYVNGHATLLEKISLADKPKNVETRVNDLLFRMEHVMQQGNPPSFVALYDVGPEHEPRPVEHHLRAIEAFSHTVDVRSDAAAASVGDYLGVKVLQTAT